MKPNKRQELKSLAEVFNYAQKHHIDDSLELKPEEFKKKNQSLLTQKNIKDIDEFKNDISLRENKIICNNIITKFLELNDEKFLACIDKTISWGFEACFKEFILKYYLYIKPSNTLRQYIVMNLDKIIQLLKTELEIYMMDSLKNFNFENYKTHQEIEFLKNDLRNRQAAMLALKAKNFNEFAPPSESHRELLSNKDRKNVRAEIINRLKYENPKLEEDF